MYVCVCVCVCGDTAPRAGGSESGTLRPQSGPRHPRSPPSPLPQAARPVPQNPQAENAEKRAPAPN